MRQSEVLATTMTTLTEAKQHMRVQDLMVKVWTFMDENKDQVQAIWDACEEGTFAQGSRDILFNEKHMYFNRVSKTLIVTFLQMHVDRSLDVAFFKKFKHCRKLHLFVLCFVLLVDPAWRLPTQDKALFLVWCIHRVRSCPENIKRLTDGVRKGNLEFGFGLGVYEFLPRFEDTDGSSEMSSHTYKELRVGKFTFTLSSAVPITASWSLWHNYSVRGALLEAPPTTVPRLRFAVCSWVEDAGTEAWLEDLDK